MASHTLLRTIIIFSVLPLLGGCSLLAPSPRTSDVGPHERVYFASYNLVWNALQKSLVKYPIHTNNIDAGLLITESIKNRKLWTPLLPQSSKYNHSTYVLTARVTRGHFDGRDSVRVEIEKKISLERDFFSGQEPLPSDGLEEKSILYRIGRELTLESALRKAYEKKQ